MKRLLLLLVTALTFVSAQDKIPEQKYISAFDFKPNDLELSRLAQPNQYFDKIGRRAGLMGYESGQFEMWVWPWKPFRNFELQFFLGTSTQPILAKDIVRTISVTPELTTLTYTYESFTVKEHIFIPRNEPGAILLLDVHSTTPLSIIPGFIPVMQPMWPCGVGGQFSYWEDDVKAYLISEPQYRSVFLCGSPAGTQMAAPPAHMFADNPIQFRIDIKPGETTGKFIPLVIAGVVPDWSTLQSNRDSLKKVVKATYSNLWQNAEKYYNECFDYYQNLRTSTMQITTPDKEINLAYEWGKVALDNLMIENPRLGYGMVAGFGLSGGGARPGFAWYFGGDAFINILTMNSVGMFQQSRDALAFTQKWQRQENYPIRKKDQNEPPKDVGKMSHELSQSDGLCDWWNDYRYGYNHADTSPWYLVAMGDYVRTSGDVEFLRQSWKSVKQAYEWCLSKDTDGDGLMDLKGAGLGALEFGKLVGIYADVYTCGVFVQGTKEMKYMAELLGDSLTAKQADEQFKKAQPRLEELFWMEEEGYYAYGATEKGEQVKEKTPWSGVAMMFGLLDEERTAKSIEAFNSADMCTDWGVRTLSNKSELFEPTNYNYGAVWPFIGTFFNTAQFKHHYALSGYQILKANIAHVFDHALGVVPEVFSGELNEKLGEGYHHQGFSTTGYMLPLVRGLLGLEVDGVGGKINVSPHVFSLTDVVQLYNVSNIIVGEDTISVEFNDATTQCLLATRGKDSIDIIFSATCRPNEKFDEGVLLLDLDTKNVVGEGESQSYSLNRQRLVGLFSKGIDNHLLLTFKIKGRISVNCYTDRDPYSNPLFLPPKANTSIGINNNGLKIITQKVINDSLQLIVEGLSGKTYKLELFRQPGNVRSSQIENGTSYSLDKMTLEISFNGKSKNEFIRKEIPIPNRIHQK
ncbi:MAG: hypothetical protein HY960_06060 [Ignavibacteriae bacterium]|nr:hypothetical protein [Ignavibacteriota bacterium]